MTSSINGATKEFCCSARPGRTCFLSAVLGLALIVQSSFAFAPGTVPRAVLQHQHLHVRRSFAHSSSFSHLNLWNGKSNNDSSETTTTTAVPSASDLDAQLDEYLQRAQLGAAVRHLKQHPKTTQLTKQRWKAIFDAIEERTTSADAHEHEAAAVQQQQSNTLRSSSSTPPGTDQTFPTESAARQEMTDMYRTLQQLQHLRLFGAATGTVPAAGSHTLPPALLEQILNLPMSALTPQPTNSLLIAGAVVAVLEGIICITTGLSINTLFLLTLCVAFFDRLLLNGAVFEAFLKIFNPAVQHKILRHEAGHFLAAYLLGCPVEGIVLSAWAALQDKRFGNRQVSAGTSFFDPQLSQQINNQAAVTRESIDRYSIIVMSGIAAEADQFGRADGGAGDEMALVGFLSRLNGKTSSTTTVWDSNAIRNQARWGALQAVLLLRTYKPAYEALVDALERGGRLGDCIHAIEKAAREHNLQPLQQPVGYLVDVGRGQASWTTTTPTTVTMNEPKSPAMTKPAWNENESLSLLKEYRAATEQRIQELDQRLKEIQE